MAKLESFTDKDAPAPFNDPRADVILRSNDSADFRVYKIILSLASPIFEAMFSLPPGNPSAYRVDLQRNGVPVVLMEERSDTLDPILRVCYPGCAPEVHDLKDFANILTGVEKYEIKAFDQLAQTVMLRHLADAPVKVYALACRFGFDTIVHQSSRACLSLSYSDMTSKEPPEISLLTSWQYRKLLRYHRLVFSRTKRCSSCMTAREKGEWFAPAYVWAYLSRAEIALKEEPSFEMLKQASFLARLLTGTCDKCKMDRSGRVVELAAIFANAVRDALAEVALP